MFLAGQLSVVAAVVVSTPEPLAFQLKTSKKRQCSFAFIPYVEFSRKKHLSEQTTEFPCLKRLSSCIYAHT